MLRAWTVACGVLNGDNDDGGGGDDDDDDDDSVLTVVKYTYVANTRIRMHMMRYGREIPKFLRTVPFPCDSPSLAVTLSGHRSANLATFRSSSSNFTRISFNQTRCFVPIRQILGESLHFSPFFLAGRITRSISRGLVTDPMSIVCGVPVVVRENRVNSYSITLFTYVVNVSHVAANREEKITSVCRGEVCDRFLEDTCLCERRGCIWTRTDKKLIIARDGTMSSYWMARNPSSIIGRPIDY